MEDFKKGAKKGTAAANAKVASSAVNNSTTNSNWSDINKERKGGNGTGTPPTQLGKL